MFLGIGLFFSVLMLGLTWLQARYTPFSPSNSEEFSSASRSIKPGLIASGIVSAWTWAATLVRHCHNMNHNFLTIPFSFNPAPLPISMAYQGHGGMQGVRKIPNFVAS